MGDLLFLSNGNYIGLYDSITNQYQNINIGPLSGLNISSIDIAPNGNLWAISGYKLGIYDGTGWQVFTHYAFGGFNEVIVKNDSTGYIATATGNKLLKFQNSQFDTITLPYSTTLSDWDIDTLGNLWLGSHSKLLRINDSLITIFDSTNTPINTSIYNRVKAGSNGHIWVSGTDNKILEFDGVNWSVLTLPIGFNNVDNIVPDSLNNLWIVAGSTNWTKLIQWNGSLYSLPHDFPFNPIQNCYSISQQNVLTNEGVFSGLGTINNYYGPPLYPEVTEINCLRTEITLGVFTEYFGTTHGIYSPNGVPTGLDTANLPNDTINYILTDNGINYICSNGGLLIYDGTNYSIYDTSNSPIPSNKIKFASYANGKLYLGTDNGIAIFFNNQWTIYDSSYFGLPMNVTGVVSNDLLVFYDSATYISTLGSGLIKLFPSGGFQILNTSNGLFEDDTLYYALFAGLGMCGDWIIVGTNNKGVALNNLSLSQTWTFYNSSNGMPFDQSLSAAYFISGDVVLSTNTGFYFGSFCGTVKENSYDELINVFPNPSDGKFTLNIKTNSIVQIKNMYGETIFNSAVTAQQSMDLSGFAKGVYIITTKDEHDIIIKHKIIIQ